MEFSKAAAFWKTNISSSDKRFPWNKIKEEEKKNSWFPESKIFMIKQQEWQF